MWRRVSLFVTTTIVSGGTSIAPPRRSASACLDHIFILGERHLERVLREYCFQYFNPARSHQGIGQLVPTGSANSASGDGDVVAVPVLGGLHHDYRRAA